MAPSPPANLVALQADLYQTLKQHADALHRPVDDLVSDLIKESLLRFDIEQERQREIARRDEIMDEIIAETERLGLYESYRPS